MATPTSEKTDGVFLPQSRQDAIFRKIKWRILPFLVLCYIVAFIDRSNIGFAKLEFSADLGFDDAVYGLGASLFYLGYVLFEVPSNLLLHKIGVRKTFLRIMMPWGLVAAAAAFMVLPYHYYILRFLLGAAEAGFFPGVLLYLTYWIPSRRRAKVMAIFLASIAISGVIGGPISGAIMHAFDGIWGLAGWQWVFIVEGLPACALGVVAYFYLSDRPAQAKWLSREERHQAQQHRKRRQGKGNRQHSDRLNHLTDQQNPATIESIRQRACHWSEQRRREIPDEQQRRHREGRPGRVRDIQCESDQAERVAEGRDHPREPEPAKGGVTPKPLPRRPVIVGAMRTGSAHVSSFARHTTRVRP